MSFMRTMEDTGVMETPCSTHAGSEIRDRFQICVPDLFACKQKMNPSPHVRRRGIDKHVFACDMAVIEAEVADRFDDSSEVHSINGQVHVLGQAGGQRVAGLHMKQYGQSTHNAIFNSGFAKSMTDPLRRLGETIQMHVVRLE